MWEISNNLQLLSFFRAAVLGGIFCLLYDLFRSIAKAAEFKEIAVFFQDVIYFLILAPVTFCFLLATSNGQMRLYIFVGILIGFVCVRVLLSKVLTSFLTLIFKSIFKFFGMLSAFQNRVLGAFNDKISKLSKKLKVFCQKAIKLAKKLLKKE